MSKKLTAQIESTTKYPQSIECVDSIFPKRNKFTLMFPSKDVAINFNDEVVIKRDNSDLFKGIVMDLKPALTESGHYYQVSGMNFLGKLLQRFTKEELLLETEAASLIKRFNQPCIKVSNKGWSGSASGTLSGSSVDYAIDRLSDTYWECDVNQVSGEYYKVDMGDVHQICRIRIEHKLGLHPDDFKILLVGIATVLTTDVDWDAGTFNQTERIGTGESASVRLGLSAGAGLLYYNHGGDQRGGFSYPTNGSGAGQCITTTGAFAIKKLRMKLMRLDIDDDFDVRGVVHNVHGTVGSDARTSAGHPTAREW